MLQIQRYLFSELLRITLVITTTLTLIVLLTQSLRLFEILVKSSDVLKILGLSLIFIIPTFLGIVLPISLGISVLFFYYKKILDNEVIILQTMGQSAWQIGLPAVFLGLCVMCLGFVLSFYGTPWGYQHLKDLKNTAVREFAPFLLQQRTFTKISPGLTVYIQDQASTGALSQIILYDHRNPEKQITLIADYALIQNTTNGIRLLLKNGLQQQFDTQTGKFSELYFENYAFQFEIFNQNPSPDEVRPLREYSITELFALSSQNVNAVQKNTLLVELHARFVTPSLGLNFTLISLVCLLCGAYDRQRPLARLLRAVPTITLLQALSFGLIAFARTHPGLISFIYLTHILPLLVSIWLLSRESFLTPKSNKNIP